MLLLLEQVLHTSGSPTSEWLICQQKNLHFSFSRYLCISKQLFSLVNEYDNAVHFCGHLCYNCIWGHCWALQLQWVHHLLYYFDWCCLSYSNTLGLVRRRLAVRHVRFHTLLGGEWCTMSCFREFHDFAGSGVVHLSGGIVALVGAIMLGPRIGRFRQGTKVSYDVFCWSGFQLKFKGEDDPAISGHSIPLISLGAFILIFGFFAFNGGSQVCIMIKIPYSIDCFHEGLHQWARRW